MGQRDTRNQGYPRSTLKRDWQHIRYCGGSGSGACAQTLSQTYCYFAIWVNPYITRIRDLVLNNPENGVRIYTDGGVSGLCSHSFATEVPWYLGFHYNDLLTYDEVVAQGMQFYGESLPYDIEVPGRMLPQPSDENWDGIIWCYIAWGSTSYVAAQDLTNYTQWLRPAKIDYDQRL